MKKTIFFCVLVIALGISSSASGDEQKKAGDKDKSVQQKTGKPPTTSKQSPNDTYTQFIPQKKVDADTAIALPADI